MKNLKLSTFTFITIFIIDQILKMIMVEGQIVYSSAYINLALSLNPGIIFGNLSNADPLIRTIFFSSFFILVLFIAIFIQFYFLREDRYLKLSIALSIFVAGVSGNAFDRIRLGYAIDYAHFPFGFFNSYVLNFADFIQILGVFLCLIFFYQLRDDLLPHDNERGFSLVDARYQVGFSLKLSFISFFSMLMTGTFAFAFLKVYLPAFDEKIKNIFIFSWIIIGLLLMICSFLFGLILSSRTIGPIYALERFVRALGRGENADLKLRSLDSFRRLENLAEHIRELQRKK